MIFKRRRTLKIVFNQVAELKDHPRQGRPKSAPALEITAGYNFDRRFTVQDFVVALGIKQTYFM